MKTETRATLMKESLKILERLSELKKEKQDLDIRYAEIGLALHGTLWLGPPKSIPFNYPHII